MCICAVKTIPNDLVSIESSNPELSVHMCILHMCQHDLLDPLTALKEIEREI